MATFRRPQPWQGEYVRCLPSRVSSAAALIEPTCGLGNFLFAALDAFTTVQTAFAAEVNREYVRRGRVTAENVATRAK